MEGLGSMRLGFSMKLLRIGKFNGPLIASDEY